MMNFLSKFLSGKPEDGAVNTAAPDSAEAVAGAAADSGAEAYKPERPVAPQPAPASGSEKAPHEDPAFREAMQHSYSPPFVDGGYADGGMLEEFEANAGQPIAEGVEVATEAEVIDAMRTVYDPEIPVNIYDLGLIYEFDIADNGNIAVQMSLTAPGCPVAGEMPGMVADAVARVDGVGEVNVKLVWEPMWTPERMSEDARLALGMI